MITDQHRCSSRRMVIVLFPHTRDDDDNDDSDDDADDDADDNDVTPST